MNGQLFTEQVPEPEPVRRRLPGVLRRGVWLAAALLLGVLLGATGYGVYGAHFRPGAAGAVPAAATTSELQADLIAAVQRVSPAVVSIRAGGGLGSGVIYDPSGLILTNAHVVGGARNVSIELADGRRFQARVLGADPGFDLAVLKVDASDLPVAPLGDSSQLQVGQFVAAIGNPYGLDHTVTVGVISALNRPIAGSEAGYTQPMIQTDAAINPGNSGGPLIDLAGNVIGINTLVAAPAGVPAQGLGFAVPVNTAKRIAGQLASQGRVTQSGLPYLGVRITDAGGRATPGVDYGALIVQVEPNGPAAQAGLRAGDVITAVDGHDVYSVDHLLQQLLQHKPGDRVTVQAVRSGQTITVTVTLGEAPSRSG